MNGNCAKGRHGGGNPRRILPEDVEQYIRESLHEHRFISLRQRCNIIHERFGFRLAHGTLQRTYQRMGISYQRTKTVYKAARSSLKEAFKHFARRHSEIKTQWDLEAEAEIDFVRP